MEYEVCDVFCPGMWQNGLSTSLSGSEVPDFFMASGVFEVGRAVPDVAQAQAKACAQTGLPFARASATSSAADPPAPGVVKWVPLANATRTNHATWRLRQHDGDPV
jgi:hypothetical protein